MGRSPKLDNHTSPSRRWTRIIAVLAVLTVISVPVAVFAAGGHFTDDDDSIFESSIDWMADSGVTLGCNPPTNDRYCPDDNVTRGQMAAFMQRLAENKVVDAATAVEADDATTVGGYAPDDLIRAAGAHISIPLGSGVALGATTPFGTVNITAPVDGVLLVNGSLNLYCSGGLLGCNQSDGNTYVNVDGDQYNRQYYAVDGGDSTLSGAAWNSSNTAYVPVSAGDHTVAIDVANTGGGAGATYVWSGGINVLFVPFGGDGNTPAAVMLAETAAAAGQN
jgi:hypothetical protein